MDENNIVRIGVVTDIDKGTHKARVKFLDDDYTSGWLPVIQHVNTAVSVNDGRSGVTTYWMPKVNDTVLCIYLDLFNADGFVLGGIPT